MNVVVVQSLSHVRHFVTPWTAARQASLSLTISRSLSKFVAIELVILFNDLMLCHLLLCLLFFSVFFSIMVFSSELARHIKYMNNYNHLLSM